MGLRVRYADGDEEEWPIDATMATQKRAAARPSSQTARYVFRGLRARRFWETHEAGRDIARLCSELERNFAAIAQEVRQLVQPLVSAGGDTGSSDEGDDGDGLPQGRASVQKHGQWSAQREGLHSGVYALKKPARANIHDALAHTPCTVWDPPRAPTRAGGFNANSGLMAGHTQRITTRCRRSPPFSRQRRR
jgi:hypothetical protein